MARLPKSVGIYEVTDRIGEGGMGEILLGFHPLLQREVAIKRLLPDMAKDDAMVERFFREGKALAKLQHQAICAVFDMAQKAGTAYIVLEYVDGYDLAHILKSGPMPVDVAAIVGLEVADALDHAHFHGVLHRDIKPPNVMISKTGDIKLMDFGIALVDDLERMTATGLMVGTPMYMAPEVICGEEPDERSDIYSLGAMLYQCLSGQKMFAHANAQNIYPLIEQGRFPPLKKIAPRVPRALRRIVDRCIQRKPEKRYETAAELRQDLETFLATHHGWAQHQERLVAFLHVDGHISEDEALTCIDADQLVISREVELKPPRQVWAGIATLLFISLLALAGGLAVAAQTGYLSKFEQSLGGRGAEANPAAPTDEAAPADAP